MRLNELSPAERRELAEKIGTNPLYIWQCATGRRTLSPRLAKLIVQTDARFTLDEIYAGAATAPPQAADG